jgi:hypothetical protein
LICNFKLAEYMVGSGVWRVYVFADEPAFLKRNPLELGVYRYQQVRVQGHTGGKVPIQEHLTNFSNVNINIKGKPRKVK